MPSSILNSDDGVISGTSGLKSSGGDDGVLVFQSKGTETARINTDKQIVAAAGTASLPALTTTGDVNTGIFFPAADTIAFAEGGAEAMRINSSGNVGIGTTSPGQRLQVVDTNYNFSLRNDAANFVYLTSKGLSGTTYGGFVFKGIRDSDGAEIERARITSGGYFKASDDGTYGNSTGAFNEYKQTANDIALQVWASNASQTSTVININASRNTSNGTYNFITANVVSVGARFVVADSGNVTNSNGSYGTISDAKLKQDIVDASSQWNDIKALRLVKYRLKSNVEQDENTPSLLGVIAQEVEQVSPGLVDNNPDFETTESGEQVATGTVTKSVKTSIIYMKAVKALQEAMERIETLEAKNDALEARLSALEAVPGNE
jgi:hypothetical protein